MKKIHLALLTVSIGVLAACTTTHAPAPVVDRTPTPPPSKPVEVAKPAPKPVSKPVADSQGFYTVRKGDTLLRIALDFGQNYRDLIAWNNLSNPNDIKVDQVLRVLPPEPASAGVQTGSVAPPGGVEIKPQPAAPSASAVAAPHKTTPRGDKRAYSEAALAELQKAEPPATPAAPSAAVAKAEPPKPIDTKPAAPSPAGGDEDAVAWIWPADGKVIGTFDDGRKGIDIAGQAGQQVLAAGDGKVMYAGSGIRGYGNLVIVKHTNTLLSAYAHNKTILVKEGQTVSKGQKIAEMGSSDTDSVKLHFEIRQQGKPVDPSKFLPNR
ncbi:MAG TPA: peptidoglycan DD-metalloendopeptidase family protein [Paucimonas sp.]|nr:peptidoglycan DD-metalloendopeptidase family protein [Paucimonas sp.]